MITLSVSSDRCRDASAVARAFERSGVHAQITPTASTVTRDGAIRVEPGFVVRLFNVRPTRGDFVRRVWRPLVELLGVECGHVDGPAYRGCTADWPGVMVESRCPGRGVAPPG